MRPCRGSVTVESPANGDNKARPGVSATEAGQLSPTVIVLGLNGHFAGAPWAERPCIPMRIMMRLSTEFPAGGPVRPLASWTHTKSMLGIHGPVLFEVVRLFDGLTSWIRGLEIDGNCHTKMLWGHRAGRMTQGMSEARSYPDTTWKQSLSRRPQEAAGGHSPPQCTGASMRPAPTGLACGGAS